MGKPFARQRNELIWLEHNDERRYDTTLTVLGDTAAISAAEKRIRSICGQPDEDYPTPSANYRPISRTHCHGQVMQRANGSGLTTTAADRGTGKPGGIEQ